MEGSELGQRIKEFITKYRYAALVLLIGIVLMLVPFGKSTSDAGIPSDEQSSEAESEDFELRLARILSQIEGAGKVTVFLSHAAGEEILFQTDEDITGNDLQSKTVLVTGSGREQSGLIRQINPPIYQGAIVLCQGADNAAIRLSITQAVANATGLGTNQISVLKMK